MVIDKIDVVLYKDAQLILGGHNEKLITNVYVDIQIFPELLQFASTRPLMKCNDNATKFSDV